MKIRIKKLLIIGTVVSMIISLNSCKKDDDGPVDPGESSTELLVKKFTAAPTLDGTIEEMWGTAKRLVGTTEVPDLGARGTYLNGDGKGKEETLGLFAPYSGEKYNFTLRSGYTDTEIYFLLEWEDSDDSKDRQSWYFDATTKRWKGEHKYANAADDKFYEDKFSFLFPIGDVTGFSASTCYAVCHQNLEIVKDKDKHSRHYTKKDGEKIDMWHWKRVRGTYNNKVDDQKMVYADPAKKSSANGRTGDSNGGSGYSNNSQNLPITGTTDTISVPQYVIPDATDYYWIGEDKLGTTAKKVTAVDSNGVLSYDGGTITPADGGYEQGTGTKRIPSVLTKNFTGARADISIMATYTGKGWICEFSRKLNTGDADDVVFDPKAELAFGLAIFNNAAIAHAVKPNLTMKFE